MINNNAKIFNKNLKNINAKLIKYNQTKIPYETKNTQRKEIKYLNNNSNNKIIKNKTTHKYQVINTSQNLSQNKDNIIPRKTNKTKNQRIIINQKEKSNNLISYTNKNNQNKKNNYIVYISSSNLNNNKNEIIQKNYTSLHNSINKNNNTSQKVITEVNKNVNNTKFYLDNDKSKILKKKGFHPLHRKNLSVNINNLNNLKRNNMNNKNKENINIKFHSIIEKNTNNNKTVFLNLEKHNIQSTKNGEKQITCYNNIIHKIDVINENSKENLNIENLNIKKEEILKETNKKSNLVIKEFNQRPYHYMIYKTDIKLNDFSNPSFIAKVNHISDKNKIKFNLNNYFIKNKINEESEKINDKNNNNKNNDLIEVEINDNVAKGVNLVPRDTDDVNNNNKVKGNDEKKVQINNLNNMKAQNYHNLNIIINEQCIPNQEEKIIILKSKKKSKNEMRKFNNKIAQLKYYFAKNIKLNAHKYPKRNLSFDCRLSKLQFKLFTTQVIEQRTFDSNYYKIIKPIGKGSFGEIYLVQDPKSSKYFALKKIIINDSFELKDNQEEYKLTRKLTQTHPELKIVKKFGIEIKKLDKYNLVMYILMEASNSDWEKEILNRQKIKAYYNEKELLDILKGLVQTFKILQTMGISHRDVKPQNILFFTDQGYKLTDFGEAKNKKINKSIKSIYGFKQDTNKQTVRGTELYMSPLLFQALRSKNLECIEYNAYKSDVFSLGMCFLFASSLTYQSLFDIREVKDMKVIEESISKYLAKLYSKNYIDIIIKMLQVDEKLRPDFLELSQILQI